MLGTTYNYDKISAILNWKPTFTLEEGISETITYYQKVLVKK